MDNAEIDSDTAGVVRFNYGGTHPTMVTDLLEQLSKDESVRRDMRLIGDTLGISSAYHEDFSKIQQRRIGNSCEWLLHRSDFQEWRDEGTGMRDNTGNRIYWLSGDPGSGKTFVAARVVTYLMEDRNCNASYYFFKHGEEPKRSAGGMLKSMILQMAFRSPSLRRSLLSMRAEDTFAAEGNDLRAIWKQLFLQRVFRSDIERQQYWIIDALDEANDSQELPSLLRNSLPSGYRVFLTCRKNRELENERDRLGLKVIAHAISKDDTLEDIRIYLRHYQNDLHTGEYDPVQIQQLIERLVKKSNGSFLWITLIRQKLAVSWGEVNIESILEDVPDGMHRLYSRILQNIAQSPNRGLASVILQWVVCATRPLTTSELQVAVFLSTQKPLQRVAKAVETICTPLISVENDKVQLVHDTVRGHVFRQTERLRSDAESSFAFDKASSHEVVAALIIPHLSKKLVAPGARASVRSAGKIPEDPLIAFASNSFSEHVVKSSSADEPSATKSIIRALLEFFQGPVLFWIERQAKEENLSTLISAGKNLKACVARRCHGQTVGSPQLQDLAEIQQCAEEMIYLGTAFGEHLLIDPDSIIEVIPRLCPVEFKIYRTWQNLMGVEI